MRLIGRPFWSSERCWIQKYRDEVAGRERKLRVPREVAPTGSARDARNAAKWLEERFTTNGKPVLTVSELAARMLELWQKDTRVAPKTWEGREGHLRLHLLPVFGSGRAEDITIPALRAWVRGQRAAGVSRSGANNRLSTLALLLDDAAAEGLTTVDGAVPRHAAVRRELPEATVSTPKTISPQTFEALIGAPTTPLVWVVRDALAALAGLEDGAIAGLTWGDLEVSGGSSHERGSGVAQGQGMGRGQLVRGERGSGGIAARPEDPPGQRLPDVEISSRGGSGGARAPAVIVIRRAVAQKGPEGWASVSRTKNPHRGSDEAPRRIPVHRTLATILERWALEGFRLWTGRDPKPGDFVLPLPDGRPWRPASAEKLRAHLDAAGVAYPAGLTLHDLRGCFMTWLAALGVGEEQRKRLVGHAGDVQAEHYLGPEALLEADRAAIERIPVEVERGRDGQGRVAQLDQDIRRAGENMRGRCEEPHLRADGERDPRRHGGRVQASRHDAQAGQDQGDQRPGGGEATVRETVRRSVSRVCA